MMTIIEAIPTAVSPPSYVAGGEPVVVPCSPAMVPSPPAATHPSVSMVEVTPTVSARALGLSTEGIDQALLTALVVRGAAVGGLQGGARTGRRSRPAMRSWACCERSVARCGGSATRWSRRSIVREQSAINKPVESWGFIRQTVSNWAHGDGTPGSPPGLKPAAPPGVPCPGDASRDGKPSRPPPGSSLDAIEKELCELTAAELRDRIVEMEATLANLSSSPRLRLSEQLRGQLAQAKGLLSAREVGA